MGEIRKRGNVYWVRVYQRGRRIERSSKSERKEDAIAMMRKLEGSVANGVPVPSKEIRFDEAAKDLENDYKTNGRRSLAGVARKIKLHLTPFFGTCRLSDISAVNTRAFVDHRQAQGASNAEINRELAALKRMFSLALQAGRIAVRPHIPMLQEHNVRTGFFEDDQFEAVRTALPEALRPVVTFARLTGWRIQSEVLPLEWRHVDRAAGVVRLDPGTTKNGEGRSLPYAGVLPALRDVIEAQWTATKAAEKATGTVCRWVFHRDGRPIKSLRGAWTAACEAAGCPDRIPHDLRRTAVRNLVRAGVPEQVAMRLTGHKTRSVFDRYDIVNEADLQQALGRLSDHLIGTEKGQSAESSVVRRFRKSS